MTKNEIRTKCLVYINELNERISNDVFKNRFHLACHSIGITVDNEGAWLNDCEVAFYDDVQPERDYVRHYGHSTMINRWYWGGPDYDLNEFIVRSNFWKLERGEVNDQKSNETRRPGLGYGV